MRAAARTGRKRSAREREKNDRNGAARGPARRVAAQRHASARGRGLARALEAGGARYACFKGVTVEAREPI